VIEIHDHFDEVAWCACVVLIEVGHKISACVHHVPGGVKAPIFSGRRKWLTVVGRRTGNRRRFIFKILAAGQVGMVTLSAVTLHRLVISPRLYPWNWLLHRIQGEP
jgi:hypothetical protein